VLCPVQSLFGIAEKRERDEQGEQGPSRRAYISHAGLSSSSAQIICRKVPRRETSGGAARLAPRLDTAFGICFQPLFGAPGLLFLRNPVKRGQGGAGRAACLLATFPAEPLHLICSDLLRFIDSCLEREGARVVDSRCLSGFVWRSLCYRIISSVACWFSQPCLEHSLVMHHHHLATRSVRRLARLSSIYRRCRDAAVELGDGWMDVES
jgi:hypothetical protein